LKSDVNGQPTDKSLTATVLLYRKECAFRLVEPIPLGLMGSQFERYARFIIRCIAMDLKQLKAEHIPLS